MLLLLLVIEKREQKTIITLVLSAKGQPRPSEAPFWTISQKWPTIVGICTLWSRYVRDKCELAGGGGWYLKSAPENEQYKEVEKKLLGYVCCYRPLRTQLSHRRMIIIGEHGTLNFERVINEVATGRTDDHDDPPHYVAAI